MKNSVRKPIRCRDRASARFLLKKFVWTPRNSFGVQIFIFFSVVQLVLCIVFEADVLFTFVGRVVLSSCLLGTVYGLCSALRCLDLEDLLGFLFIVVRALLYA